MNDQTTIEFIKNLPQIIGAFVQALVALGVILAAYWAYKANKQSASAADQSKANAESIEVVRTDVNSKVDKLVQVTGEAEFAKGQKHEGEKHALENKGPMQVEIVESPVAVTVVKDDKPG